MSLRDYFAAAALKGLASNEYTMKSLDEAAKRRGITEPSKVVAAGAYAYADAMLKERDK